MSDLTADADLRRRLARTRALLAVMLAVLLAAGCGSSGTKAVGLSPAVTRLNAQWDAWFKAHPAVFTCAVQVDLLLGKDLGALEQGYDSVNMSQVLVQYGAQSATFEAFSQLQAQLAAYVVENGVSNALHTVDKQTIQTCEQFLPASDSQGAPPPGGSAPSNPGLGTQFPARAEPAPSAPVTYAAPSPELTGPPGCPGSTALMAVWQAAPASSFEAQSIAPDLQVAGFDDISCWDGWVVASAITNANGYAVFGSGGGLHLLSSTELAQFNQAVCAAADSPADWKNPAAGPANCG